MAETRTHSRGSIDLESERSVPIARAMLAGTVAALVQPAASLVASIPPVALEFHHLHGALLYGALAVHLLYGAVFAVGFALLVHRVATARRGVAATVLTGVVFGLAVWLVTVVVAWPVVLRAFGATSPPALPYLHPHPLLGHAVYGLSLGVTFWVVGDGPD